MHDGFDFGTASSIVRGDIAVCDIFGHFLGMKKRHIVSSSLFSFYQANMISHGLINMNMRIQRAIVYRFAIMTHRMYAV